MSEPESQQAAKYTRCPSCGHAQAHFADCVGAPTEARTLIDLELATKELGTARGNFAAYGGALADWAYKWGRDVLAEIAYFRACRGAPTPAMIAAALEYYDGNVGASPADRRVAATWMGELLRAALTAQTEQPQ